jgi:hypothetical protein
MTEQSKICESLRVSAGSKVQWAMQDKEGVINPRHGDLKMYKLSQHPEEPKSSNDNGILWHMRISSGFGFIIM